MKKENKLGLMAAIIGMTAAMFKRKEPIEYKAPAQPTTVGKYMFGGFRARNLQAIFIPRHSKMKGYMRDNRNWGRKR
jgi:hypothetical protein